MYICRMSATLVYYNTERHLPPASVRAVRGAVSFARHSVLRVMVPSSRCACLAVVWELRRGASMDESEIRAVLYEIRQLVLVL
jgi:hypothetical protein